MGAHLPRAARGRTRQHGRVRGHPPARPRLRLAQGRPALALRGTSRRSPDELRAESDPDLVDIIRARMEAAGGRITFAEFMELALYHPEHGYYRGKVVRSAREGDFLTAPELHPVFGRVLARQLAEMWELLDRPRPFTVREYGAGPGTLGAAIFEALEADGPPDESTLFETIVYAPVELNPAHRATLVDRFARAGLAGRLDRPSASPGPDAREAGGLVGCVLANEFVDALPVHRVEGTQSRGLAEIFVAWQDGWFAEEVDEPSTPDLARYFDRLHVTLAPGQRGEVNLALAEWLDEVGRDLERGYVLVIDYGHPAAELYSPGRVGGTLRAYRAHTAHGDPFRFVGRQDLTAHVDFTSLAEWARDRGLVPLSIVSQARFLVAAGLEGLLEAERSRLDIAADEYVALRASIGRLLDPRAMGAFRVVLLGRGVPMERLPSGFHDPESP